jgi:DNA-directed RNA polymerase specialized sigma24 family protein
MHQSLWNDEEDAKLVFMYTQGFSHDRMSSELERTNKAVNARIHKLMRDGVMTKRKRFRPHKAASKAHPLVRQLFELMNIHRCSMQEMAKGVGVSFQTIENWRHRHKPQLELLIACFNYLGYDLVVARKKDDAEN